VIKHTNTYSKADLTDKQLWQEQKHGQQYFRDIRPHKLRCRDISGNKRFCRAQIKSSTGFKPKKYKPLQTNH